MELLPLLCLCVLTRSGTTSADQHGPEIITVTEGSDVTLPCSTSEDLGLRRFEWNKDGQKEVFVYDAGSDSSKGLSGQHEQFKGRVSHFPGELRNGNASITIRDTKVTDSGNYTCEIRHLNLPNQKFLIKLLVGAAPEPSITTLDQTQDRALLQCVVPGAFPKPKVQWQDSDGNILPAKEPLVSEGGGRYVIILQTAVTKTDHYRCVSTQEEILHELYAEIYVPLHETIIIVTEGSDVTLPCSTTEDLGFRRFVWKKDDQDEVFVYNGGVLAGQHEQFKGRVSHFPGELKNGSASITIRDMKVTDSGDYTCEIQLKNLPNQKFLIKLLVGPLKDRSGENIRGAAPEPYVTILKQTQDWALLQCVVRGASPRPKVQWQDRAGDNLTAEEPQVSERGGRYNVILRTTVTETDDYRCVSTQEEIRHQIDSQIHVYISGFPTGHVVGAAVLGALFVVAVGVAVFVVRKKFHSNTNMI